MKKFTGFEHGMGIGGWLTNYKRFNVLSEDKYFLLTVGDFEHFRSYITENDIAYIASLGMDHIRLGLDQIVLTDTDGNFREEIVEIIKTFCRWCRKYNLNAVLNLHKAFGNYCDIKESVSLFESPELQDKFISFWTRTEDLFADFPDVAFELLNEVRDIPPDEWNDLAERTVDAIRGKNSGRILIVGSTCWNAADTLMDLRVYDDPNVVYTFHMYDPFPFTHQRGVLQRENCFYNRKMPYPGDVERYRDYDLTVFGNPNGYPGYDIIDRKYVWDRLQGAADFIKAHSDKILWCGEFGTIRHADISWREAWMRDVIAFLKQNGIPYCVWNYLSTPNDGNRFSLVDDDNRKILSPGLAEIIKGNVL